MSRRLLTLYGLKWNPFTPDVPVAALFRTPRTESFLFRMENLAQEGGFALLTGEPGTGKSAVLRILSDHLGKVRDLKVGVLTRPQCSMPDFYRELGDVFGVDLSPHNRWAGTKVLRERWRSFVEASLFRPVLLVDEVQEMAPAVLNELRILMSTEFDSVQLLTVVLAGDLRFLGLLQRDDLLALGTRLGVRHLLDAAPAEELAACLRHAMESAGNPRLMTDGLLKTLSEQAAGNYRVLMGTARLVLTAAAEREADKLDEKLYLEVTDITTRSRTRRPAGGRP